MRTRLTSLSSSPFSTRQFPKIFQSDPEMLDLGIFENNEEQSLNFLISEDVLAIAYCSLDFSLRLVSSLQDFVGLFKFFEMKMSIGKCVMIEAIFL